MPPVVHGTERDHRKQTTVDRTGNAMLTKTVCDRWCSVCSDWVHCGDIVAHLFCPTCGTFWLEAPPAPMATTDGGRG